MAENSDVQAEDCLVWVTERPRSEFPRESSNFWLLGCRWKFSLCYNGHRCYDIYLCKVCDKRELETYFYVTTFIRGEKKENSLYYYHAGSSNIGFADSKIKLAWFRMDSVDNALGSDMHQGKLTITFTFFSSGPLMLRVPGSEKDLSEDKCVQASVDIPPDLESLSAEFHQLLERKIFPDVKLRCEDRHISAHRSILAARSEVFNAMFRNKMAESETGTVDVTDVDSDVLHLLLQYVYSGKIPDLSYDTASSLYEAGDKYSIHALKKSCSDWMVRNLTAENCLGYLVVADVHSDEDFKERVVDFAAENLNSIKKDAWSTFNKDHAGLAISVYQRRLAPTLAEQA